MKPDGQVTHDNQTNVQLYAENSSETAKDMGTDPEGLAEEPHHKSIYLEQTLNASQAFDTIMQETLDQQFLKEEFLQTQQPRTIANGANMDLGYEGEIDQQKSFKKP